MTINEIGSHINMLLRYHEDKELVDVFNKYMVTLLSVTVLQRQGKTEDADMLSEWCERYLKLFTERVRQLEILKYGYYRPTLID